MYSVEEREEIHKFICDRANSTEHVVTLIQVGSGAQGYRDRYSDLDYVVAYDKDTDLRMLMFSIYQGISIKYKVRMHDIGLDRHLLFIYLDNGLEIDIGFGEESRAKAWKNCFKVVFDKSKNNAVTNAMISSVDNLEHENKVKYDNFKNENRDHIVMHTIRASIAIRRGDDLRFGSEIDHLRGILVSLICYQEGLDPSIGHDLYKSKRGVQIRGTYKNCAPAELLDIVMTYLYQHYLSDSDIMPIEELRSRVNEIINL